MTTTTVGEMAAGLIAGLELAKLAALPADVLETAWEVSAKVMDFEDQSRSWQDCADQTATRSSRRRSRSAARPSSRYASRQRGADPQLHPELVKVLETARADDPTTLTYLRKKKESLLEILQDALRIEAETNPSDVATMSAGES